MRCKSHIFWEALRRNMAVSESVALLLSLLAIEAFGARPFAPEYSEELQMRGILRDQTNPDEFLSTPDMIRRHGYPAETHQVTTDDGYILTMHRITEGRGGASSTIKGSDSGKPVVFLQHCLLCSSAVWVFMGPENGLGYILADAGFDVWMGNARGNQYSRAHSWLNPDKASFWDFTWHEMANYDLPAEFDYILKETGQEKLSYVGHSMGTTMFFAMSASRPEYNGKIKAMHALAPVTYLGHIKSPIRLLAPFLSHADWLAKILGQNEFLPSSHLLTLVGDVACRDEAISQDLCSNVLFLLAGYDTNQLNTTTLPVILGHLPAGCSTKTIIHYAQEVESGEFRQYDYGFIGNLEKYGTIKPPHYDLSAATAPVILHYSSNDWLASIQDVNKLAMKLPNLIEKILVPNSKFNHLDYLLAKDIRELLYDNLVDMLKKEA